jgi:hypothetical protein
MKQNLLLLFFLLSPFFSYSQPGFMQRYDFADGTDFHNAILVEDTLVIAGTVRDLELNQWGALLVKMDTLGNVLDYRMHFDTITGGSHAFASGYGLIHTSDGGYAMTSVLFFTEYITLMKMNGAGDLEFVKKFEDSNVLAVHPRKLLEVDSGFWIVGTKQRINGLGDVFIMKTDTNGVLGWEKMYGDIEVYEGIGDIVEVYDNQFVIGASKYVFPPSLTPQNSWTKSWVFSVDEEGELLWEWTSEENEESGAFHILSDQTGGWVYSTTKYSIYDPLTPLFEPRVIHRDQDFQKKWEQVISPTSWTTNVNFDLIATPGNDWVAASRWILPDEPLINPDTERWRPCCLYKLSAEGDSLWSRCDTMALGNSTGDYEYGAAVALPSGSIMAVGRFEEYLPDEQRFWGWVVKVDRDGCLEELCGVTDVEEPLQEETVGVKVSPNPAREQVRFELPGAGQLRVYDVQGRLVREWEAGAGEGGDLGV